MAPPGRLVPWGSWQEWRDTRDALLGAEPARARAGIAQVPLSARAVTSIILAREGLRVSQCDASAAACGDRNRDLSKGGFKYSSGALSVRQREAICPPMLASLIPSENAAPVCTQ